MDTVVIIEDDKHIARLVKHVLHSYELAIEHFSDGEQGGDRLLLNPRPSLIILDNLLPTTSGYEILDRMRHHERESDRTPVPVLFFSATSQPEARELAMQKGADHFLAKPFEIADLAAAINALLPAATPS